MVELLRGWTAVLLLSAAAFLALAPWLLRGACRVGGGPTLTYRRRLRACLSAAPAVGAGLVLSLCVHRPLGWCAGEGGAAAVGVWLGALAISVALAWFLLWRDLPPAPRAVRPALWVPAGAAVLSLAIGLVAVGRLTILAHEYLRGEVALRDLAASLEKHRAAHGRYPQELEQLGDNPSADVHYVPLPAEAGGDLLWAWRVVDDPLGGSAAVLTKSGQVRWVSPRELSAEVSRSVRVAVLLPVDVPARPTRPELPATAPASRPAEPAAATRPTQPGP
jgi:hypothetical protein